MSIRDVVAKYEVFAQSSPPGEGWEKAGEHGGYRKQRVEGGYEYWYPSPKHADTAKRHHQDRARHYKDKAFHHDTEGMKSKSNLHRKKAWEMSKKQNAHQHHADGAKEFLAVKHPEFRRERKRRTSTDGV